MRYVKKAKLLLLFVLPLNSSADAFPQEAQEAMDRMIGYVQEENWNGVSFEQRNVVREIESAFPEKADPLMAYPQIWFNFALAFDKRPGFLLQTAGLYRAYLLANPSAANRDKVERRIQELEAQYMKEFERRVKASEVLVNDNLVSGDINHLEYAGMDSTGFEHMTHLAIAIGNIMEGKVVLGRIDEVASYIVRAYDKGMRASTHEQIQQPLHRLNGPWGDPEVLVKLGRAIPVEKQDDVFKNAVTVAGYGGLPDYGAFECDAPGARWSEISDRSLNPDTEKDLGTLTKEFSKTSDTARQSYLVKEFTDKIYYMANYLDRYNRTISACGPTF